jgi:hypothetical protein
VPAYEGIVGNEEADEVARVASSRKGKPLAPARESTGGRRRYLFDRSG